MFLNSRRTFLKETFLTTAVLLFSSGKLYGAVSPLDTLSLVQSDLFPQSTNVPTLKQINANSYLSHVLQHSRISDANKDYLRNGVQWLNEEALELYDKTYIQLSSAQRQNTLKSISEYRWGESWIKTVMTYIYEAMLGDPVYGVNKQESGWNWLNHVGGQPRPKEALL